MVYRGRVSNGVILMDDNVVLPEGTLVFVEPIVADRPVARDDALYRLGELAGRTGVADLARNIDHYLSIATSGKR